MTLRLGDTKRIARELLGKIAKRDMTRAEVNDKKRRKETDLTHEDDEE